MSIAATTPALAALIGAALAGAVLAWATPIRIFALLWGALLPINATAYTAPTLLAAVKVLGAAVILVRCRSEDASKTVYRWLVPLCALGGLMIVDGMTTPTGSRAIGAFMIASAVIGVVMSRRPALFSPVLIGFAAGCAISAIVVIMQVLDLPTIARPSAIGANGRFGGLSVSAPFIATELALATMIFFIHARAQHGQALWARLGSAVGALICLSALLASGGRGGLLALSLAAAVAAYQGVVKVKHAIVASAGVWLAVYLAGRYSIPFSTLDRIKELNSGEAAAGGLTSNRDVIFFESLANYLEHPILGPGYGQFLDTYGIMPHFAPLTFAVTAGIAGAAIGVYLMYRLAALVVSRKRGDSGWADLAPSVAAIFFAMSCLEAEGPFMNIGFMTVLLISVRVAARDLGSDDASRSETDRENRRVDEGRPRRGANRDGGVDAVGVHLGRQVGKGPVGVHE